MPARAQEDVNPKDDKVIAIVNGHEIRVSEVSMATEDILGQLPGRRDSVCAGSMAFLMKAKMPNVAMRMGMSLGLLSMKELESIADAVIDPKDLGPSFQDDGAWA